MSFIIPYSVQMAGLETSWSSTALATYFCLFRSHVTHTRREMSHNIDMCSDHLNWDKKRALHCSKLVISQWGGWMWEIDPNSPCTLKNTAPTMWELWGVWRLFTRLPDEVVSMPVWTWWTISGKQGPAGSRDDNEDNCCSLLVCQCHCIYSLCKLFG